MYRFILDLLACFPIDLIVYALEVDSPLGSTSGEKLNFLALLKVLRLPRLLRLARFVRILRILRIPPEWKRWLLYSRYAHLLRIVQLIVAYLFIIHILSCIWNVVEVDWVNDIYGDTTISNVYILGFYYTLITCMGQNASLRTENEYIFSTMLVIVGALLLAIVFGNVADLIGNFYESPNNYRKKVCTRFELF